MSWYKGLCWQLWILVETVFAYAHFCWDWAATNSYVCWRGLFLELSWDTELLWVIRMVRGTLMVRFVAFFRVAKVWLTVNVSEIHKERPGSLGIVRWEWRSGGAQNVLQKSSKTASFISKSAKRIFRRRLPRPPFSIKVLDFSFHFLGFHKFNFALRLRNQAFQTKCTH